MFLPSSRVTRRFPLVHWWIQCWKAQHFCSTSEVLLVINRPVLSIRQYFKNTPFKSASTEAYGIVLAGRYIRWSGITLCYFSKHRKMKLVTPLWRYVRQSKKIITPIWNKNNTFILKLYLLYIVYCIWSLTLMRIQSSRSLWPPLQIFCSTPEQYSGFYTP